MIVGCDVEVEGGGVEYLCLVGDEQYGCEVVYWLELQYCYEYYDIDCYDYDEGDLECGDVDCWVEIEEDWCLDGVECQLYDVDGEGWVYLILYLGVVVFVLDQLGGY